MAHFTSSIEDGIATLVLNHPPQNRIGWQAMAELDAALDAVGHSDARVVLLRADGPDFSFGADLTTWDYADVLRALRTEFERSLAVANRFERLPLPVIAAVQGRCLGGGFELVLRADVIFAADSARFGHPEQTAGLVALFGGNYRVAERAGRSRAAEWAFTSEQVPAPVMAAAGVVNRTVADEALVEEARAFARQLAKGPTLAYAAHKALLRAWADGGVSAADDALFDIAMPLFETEDVKEDVKDNVQAAIDAIKAGKPRPAFTFHSH